MYVCPNELLQASLFNRHFKGPICVAGAYICSEKASRCPVICIICCAGTGQLVNVKIIRNKNAAVSEGYGFVEFATHEAAEQVLRTFNGWPIPNTDQIFRLNWAAFGVGKVTTDCETPSS